MVGIVVGLFLRKEDEMADACFTIYAGWGGRFVVTGWSVLVALCLMIQKVWKWVKSFMVVAIVDFLLHIWIVSGICSIFYAVYVLRVWPCWYISYDSMLTPWIGFLEWVLSHDSMLTPWIEFLEWVLSHDSLLTPWVGFLECVLSHDSLLTPWVGFLE